MYRCLPNERGYIFDFGSNPTGTKLYLDHRFEMISDLKVIVEKNLPNTYPVMAFSAERTKRPQRSSLKDVKKWSP